MKYFLKHFALWMGLLLLTLPLHSYLVSNGIKVIYNHGFIFGSFQDGSIYVRIVALAVFSGIIGIVASFFYAFLPKELVVLRYGMTLYLAGVAGNILQKIYYGMVWDFIKVSFGGYRFYYNFNDAYQWIAIFVIVYQVFSEQDLIWATFQNGKRKQLILYKDIQLSITIRVLGLISLASITQGFLAITMFFPHLNESHGDTKLIYIASLVSLNAILLPMLGYFILKELVRCLRPVYVLEQKFRAHDAMPVRFRKDDHFEHLASNYNHFLDRIKNVNNDKP